MAPPLREMLTSTEPEHCNDRVYRQTWHWGILPHKSQHPLFNDFVFFFFLSYFITSAWDIFQLISLTRKQMSVYDFNSGKFIVYGEYNYYLIDLVRVFLNVFFLCFYVHLPICVSRYAACMRGCVCLFVPHWCPRWLRCHQPIDFQFPFTEKGGCLSCG